MSRRIKHLRRPAEFRSVYEKGQRFDGKLMTVFVLANSFDNERMGVTASRKLAKSAVMRNRVKRLLRETFRLTTDDRTRLFKKYDWVLNGRRLLCFSQMTSSLEEFRRIISQVQRQESAVSPQTEE